MVTLIHTVTQKEYMDKILEALPAPGICDEDSISLDKAKPSTYVVLFRKSNGHFECYMLDTIVKWLHKSLTLPLSRHAVPPKVAELLMIWADIVLPPPPPPRPRRSRRIPDAPHVTVRRGRRRGNASPR